MRWFLRSAVAAAGLGAVAPAHGQYEPPPMMPPVRPLSADEPPAAGITRSLVVPAPARAAPAAPAPAPRPAPPAVPAASAGKSAPPEVVSDAVPAAASKPAPPQTVLPARDPIRQVRADEPERPDRLPPLLPTLPPMAPPKPPAQSAAPPHDPPARLNGNGLPLSPESSAALPKPLVAPPAPKAPGPRTAKSSAIPPFPATASVPAKAAAEPAPGGPCPTDRVAAVACPPTWRVLPDDRIRARGGLNGGYVYNSSNPDSKFNGPYNAVDRSAEPMLNQAYLIVDRPLPRQGFGAGFRVDALFGTDHFLAQSRGFEVDRDSGRRWNGEYYGLAVPQAYAEVGTDRVSLKVGHFYTTVGYEMVPATGNFFYTHAYSYQFGQPFTHWGGLLNWKVGRNWDAHAGLVNGWDTLVGRANNVNVLAGLRYTADSGLWWSSFALVSGQEQNNVATLPGVAGTDGNRSRYSFLVGLTPGGPRGRWEYVFHNYYGFQENATPQGSLARWYGIDQYLYYRVSCDLKAGIRAEWFRDEDGTRVGLNRAANPNNPPLPGNYFGLTGGLNYAPAANLMIRPEVRWDFTSDTVRRAFNDGRKNNQFLLGCDVVWQF